MVYLFCVYILKLSLGEQLGYSSATEHKYFGINTVELNTHLSWESWELNLCG